MCYVFAGPPDVVPDVVNIGCYKDRPGGLLTGHSENMGFSTSHTRCVSRCFQLGFDYTGIKKGYLRKLSVYSCCPNKSTLTRILQLFFT